MPTAITRTAISTSMSDIPRCRTRRLLDTCAACHIEYDGLLISDVATHYHGERAIGAAQSSVSLVSQTILDAGIARHSAGRGKWILAAQQRLTTVHRTVAIDVD